MLPQSSKQKGSPSPESSWDLRSVAGDPQQHSPLPPKKKFSSHDCKAHTRLGQVSAWTWSKGYVCFNHWPRSTTKSHCSPLLSFRSSRCFKVPGLHSLKFKGSSREGMLSFSIPVLFPDGYFVVSSLVIWSHLNRSLWPGKWSNGLDCLRTGPGRCRHNLHCWNCIERKQRKVPVSLPADGRQGRADEAGLCREKLPALCCLEAVRWVTRLTGYT